MRALTVTAVFALLGAAGCGRNGAGVGAEPATAATVHGFPVPAGATRVCGQSVMGQDGSHLEWEIWASPLTTAELATWLRGRASAAAVEETGDRITFRVPDARTPAHVADVHAPEAAGVPRCQEPTPAGTRSLVNLSSMTTPTPGTPGP